MDSQTVVKTLKDNSAHPMFNVSGTPLQDISSTENHSIAQENAIDDSEISIFEAQKYFSEDSNDIKRQQQREKPSHDLPSVQRLPSVSSVEEYGRNFSSKSLRATPKASSEASWNSQTGLLSNPPGSTKVSLKNLALNCTSKRWSAAKKWFLRRNCCCSGEKSVRVKEITSDSEHREPIVLIDTMKSSNRNSNKLHTDGDQRCSITDSVVEIHHIKAMALKPSSLSSAASSSSMDAPRLQRISATGRPFIDGAVGFTFPILNSSSNQAASPPGLKAIVAKSTVSPLENTVGEGFQPVPSMENINVNARCPCPFRPGSPIPREDDVGSDASSDLFEIESFSTQTSSCPMHCWWDSVDENSNNAGSLVLENGITNVQHCRRSIDEEAAAAVKCVAEGAPLIPLHVAVGGRSPRGSSPPSPLSVGFMA